MLLNQFIILKQKNKMATILMKDVETGKNARVQVIEQKDRLIGYTYYVIIKGTNTISRKMKTYQYRTFFRKKVFKVARKFFNKWLKGEVK